MNLDVFEPKFRAGISAPDRYGLACENYATTLTKFVMKNIFDLFDRFAIFSLKLGVWRNRCFWCGKWNFGNWAPKFWGRTGLITKNFGIIHLLPKNPAKIELAPNFGVPELYAKIWHCFRTLKIGDGS